MGEVLAAAGHDIFRRGARFIVATRPSGDIPDRTASEIG
jgi:hypothetical protein